MSKCSICEMTFDGDTKFVEVNGERICRDCISDMTSLDLLDKLGIEFDCIGWPEPERC